MAHIVFVLLLSGWFFSTPLAAREVGGVKLDDQVQLGGTPLVLNGAGVRSEFFAKVYVGALYLSKPSKSIAEILEMSGPKRIAMHFLHDEVSEEKLLDAYSV
ncbi:MAG: chalcone isomerase family protein [Gammaproteobacteria bacterium]